MTNTEKYDPENAYSINYMWGTTGIGYNVEMIKERMADAPLDSWNLIRLRHLPNDRRDHFTTPDDVWEIFRTLIEERRKREVEPTLSMLRDTLLQKPQSEDDDHALERMRQMHDLIELLTRWESEMRNLETKRLTELLKMGSRINRLYEMRDKLKALPGGRKSS